MIVNDYLSWRRRRRRTFPVAELDDLAGAEPDHAEAHAARGRGGRAAGQTPVPTHAPARAALLRRADRPGDRLTFSAGAVVTVRSNVSRRPAASPPVARGRPLVHHDPPGDLIAYSSTTSTQPSLDLESRSPRPGRGRPCPGSGRRADDAPAPPRRCCRPPPWWRITGRRRGRGSPHRSGPGRCGQRANRRWVHISPDPHESCSPRPVWQAAQRRGRPAGLAAPNPPLLRGRLDTRQSAAGAEDRSGSVPGSPGWTICGSFRLPSTARPGGVVVEAGSTTWDFGWSMASLSTHRRSRPRTPSLFDGRELGLCSMTAPPDRS